MNTHSLLAFDAHLSYDIRMLGNAGILAGGLFNLMAGRAWWRYPTGRRCSWTARSSRLSWTAGRDLLVMNQPQIKSTFKVSSPRPEARGESFQLAFHGPGFVVQPSEATIVAASRAE